MRLVYVHGAGRQENRQLLKRRLDQHLFGANQLDRTMLAYYADVLHLEPELPDDLEAVEQPEAAAIRQAFEARAIEVAAAQPRVRRDPESPDTEELPDPAFLILARLASRDVTAYLLEGKTEPMRAPVRDVLTSAGSPVVVIAHSLGTVVTFDALRQLGSDAPEVALLLTVGSPLGISNILDRLIDGMPPPPKVPSTVARWMNVADPFDPVALVPELSPRFDPLGSIIDRTVDNRSFLNHDLTGYLDTSLVRTLVRDAAGWSAAALYETTAPQPGDANAAPADLMDAVRSARTHAAMLLAIPHVIAVRGGYKFAGGRITDTAAVVVAVDRKLDGLSEHEQVPAVLPDGMPTDVTIADPVERLAASGELEGVGGIAAAQPQPLLIDELQALDDETIELEAMTPITYVPPPDATLDPVTGPMAVICHVSPDAGWGVLRPFLEGTQGEITLGMYDFTAPHVFETARNLLQGSSVDWQQTLGPHESLPGPNDPDSTKADDHTEAVVNAGLQAAAPTRFVSTFAHVGTNRTFASAYHIKVAVRDRAAVWLSSGNWQSSNQPPMDFQDPAVDRTLLRRYNRDWHVVVENAPLAETFRRYLRHDFDTAEAELEAAVAPEPELPDLLVPVEDELEAAAVPLDVFVPRRFEFSAADPLTIQPILTPDNYVDIVLTLLRDPPRERLYFQNQSLNPILSPTPEWTELLGLLATYSRDPALDVRIIFRDIFLTRKKIESIKAAGFNMDRVRAQVGCHTKGIIIDSTTVVIGSHNWTNQGVQANRDASLLIRRPEIAQYYEQIFLHDWDRIARSVIDEEAMPVPVSDGGRSVALEAVTSGDGRAYRRVRWVTLEEDT